MFIVPTFTRSYARSFARSPLSALVDADERRTPAADIAEADTAYVVTLDVPGVAKDDVQVTIEGRRVSVEAKSAVTEEKKDDAQRVVYRERNTSHFARSFTLPVELDKEQSTAKLENGVLTLTLVKRSPAVSRLQIN